MNQMSQQPRLDEQDDTAHNNSKLSSKLPNINSDKLKFSSAPSDLPSQVYGNTMNSCCRKPAFALGVPVEDVAEALGELLNPAID